MSLQEWFGKGQKGAWVDIGAPKKDGKFQKCGRKKASASKRAAKSGRKYPKCVPRSVAKRMTEGERKSAVRRKRSKAQGVGGKPTNVKTFVKKANGGLMSKNHRGCGAVMPDRRKVTKYS